MKLALIALIVRLVTSEHALNEYERVRVRERVRIRERVPNVRKTHGLEALKKALTYSLRVGLLYRGGLGI